MNRILIIGSPGSGKSTLSRLLANKLNYPILHLDRVFHIDNEHQISRESLIKIITDFVDTHSKFIIDGNYSSTLEYRMQFSDTVIIMDLDTELCLYNIEQRRLSNTKRYDIAPGFDNGIRDESFVEYVKSFKEDHYQKITNLIDKYPNLDYYVLKNYEEVKNFIKKI
ncbi:MAG: AAA family ATPase [Tenericutes bacterium]|jgi:adenylate kinase family enzyme|nr:AAA family ATPase [Mycoplasmatota bacterium]